MPIPKPRKNEDKESFLGRCMGNDTMVEEYPDEKQRYAICQTAWKDKENNTMPDNIEKRTFQVEYREADGEGHMVGHAAVFNEETRIGNFFREKIDPGAFAESITNDDIRALFNHNPDYVLGRNTAGTLTLEEDERGLAIKISPPDTQFARDLKNLMHRGDINQMSFGFQVIEEDWEHNENGLDLRTLKKVRLFDVSPVTFPAYEGTDIAMRSHDRWMEEMEEMEPREDRRFIKKELRRLKLKKRRSAKWRD